MDIFLALFVVLVSISTILQGVGTFTPGWINFGNGHSGGLYSSYGWDGSVWWITAPQYLMGFSCVLWFFMLPVSLILMHNISKHGYLSEWRGMFYAYAVISAISIGLTIICLIFVGTNIDSGASLSYSAWICVGSMVSFLGVIGICIYINRNLIEEASTSAPVHRAIPIVGVLFLRD